MDNFIKVRLIDGTTSIVNLSSVIQIEKGEGFYKLIFGVYVNDGQNFWLHYLNVTDDLEEVLPILKSL